jgi:two-component system, sensor histidine kinase and response regulator
MTSDILSAAMNRRVLVIDDNEAIHADFRKILTPAPIASVDLLVAEADLFGTAAPAVDSVSFDLVAATQGQEGFEIVQRAQAAGRPFAMAFVDMRMPPGWDGLETIQRIWAVCPEIEVVICTAFSDYSWEETVRRLGRTDRLLIVKKPFDHIEVLQVASALTHKWNLQQQARRTLSDLSRLVHERTLDLERARDDLLSLNRDLVQARDTAEAANRSKTIFLANISHELRTPMTAIVGYTEELQLHLCDLPSVSPEREALETIRRNAQHLVVIIGDLLDMSKIEAGKLTVERIPTEPMQVVEEVLTLLQPKAARKNLTLTCDWATPIPDRVLTDPLRLRQILLNLVDNAIKFTATGGVRVVVSLAPTEPRLVVEVHDSGVGIAPDALPRLFQPFQQADASTTRQFGGTGLGLAISRQLAALLGGTIEVTSRMGHGTCFTATVSTGPLDGVSLVTASPERQRTAAPATTPPAPTAGGKRILVADDGRDNQQLLRRILERAGYDIEVVHDGVQCLQRMQQSVPPIDLILMDVQMPNLDGLAATTQLRAQGCRLPIVALTANAMPADREQCTVAGCDAFLTKPIDREQLVQTIARLVRPSEVR